MPGSLTPLLSYLSRGQRKAQGPFQGGKLRLNVCASESGDGVPTPWARHCLSLYGGPQHLVLLCAPATSNPWRVGGRAHVPRIVAVERPKPKYRGVLHTWCALSSPVWCGYQLSLCDAGNTPAAGLSLFAMAFLFSASAMFHRGRWTLAQERRLMKLDYIGIFLLVAFSVAPCYVQLLPPASSYPVLGAPPRPPRSIAWPVLTAEPPHALHAGLLALTVVAGAWLTLAELNLGRHGMVAVYVAQAVVQLVPLSTTLLSNRPVFASLLPAERAMFGVFGACYLVGSQVYAYQAPKLWPSSFGYHELWHLLIAASVVLTYAINCSVLANCSSVRPCYG